MALEAKATKSPEEDITNQNISVNPKLEYSKLHIIIHGLSLLRSIFVFALY